MFIVQLAACVSWERPPGCLHVAGRRGGGLRPLVQLALGAEAVVQVGRAGAVARAARPAAAAARAPARALQRRPQLRRHLRTQRRLHTQLTPYRTLIHPHIYQIFRITVPPPSVIPAAKKTKQCETSSSNYSKHTCYHSSLRGQVWYLQKQF